MAVLKVLKGASPGQIVEIGGERMILGRHPNCEVVLENGAVSRHHAQILANHGLYYIEDLRSRNGTQVNDSDIASRCELKDADTITVCDFTFRFYLEPPPEDDDSDTADLDARQDSKLSSKYIVKKTHEDRVGTATEDLSDSSIREISDIVAQGERSSIISTLDSGSSSDLRLGVQPEVKLRAVLEISQVLSQVLDYDEVLKKILDALFKIFFQADEGFIILRDAKSEKLAIRASKTRSPQDHATLPISMTIVKQCMDTGEAILSANASEDSQFSNSESLQELRIRSMICAPLTGKTGKTLGVIQITTGNLRAQFSQDDLDLLSSVASQASLAIENAALHQAVLHQRDLERDLEFATQVQLGFLPNERPRCETYDFADFYEAAQRVGGDYFDYVILPDHRIAVTLADVAGKGVPAALLMARMYSSARYHLLTKPRVADAMIGLNAEIATSGMGHRFITCVIVVIDQVKNTITVANAGHLPPIRRHPDGSVTILDRKTSSMPLGIVPTQEFRQTEYEIELGETWVLYTDGITEAMTQEKSLYGMDRLVSFIANGPNDVEALTKGIVADVETFSKGLNQSDDMCLVCFRRHS